MTTKREAIMSAIKTSLTGISGVSDANIFRSRIIPLDHAKFPAINIDPITESADNQIYSVNDWTLHFKISIYVKAKIPDQSGDTVMLDVHSKLTSNATLKNLIQDLVINSNNFNNYESDGGFGLIEMNYSIKYRTQENSLT